MHKFFLSVIGVIALLSVSACNEWSSNKSQATKQNYAGRIEARNAQRLADGKAALAQCIEVKCSVLNLDSYRLSDYTVLNELTHVTSLMVSSTTFSDLNDISEMTQLTELHMSLTNVSDLTGLKRFSNLRLLHATWLPADIDKTPIGHLTGLTELALDDVGQPSNAAFIAGMPQLENLILSWSGLGDSIEFLRDHPSLKNMELKGQLPTDQTPLLALPQAEAILLGYQSSLTPVDQSVATELEERGVLSIEEPVIIC